MTINDFGGILVLVLAAVGTFCSTIFIMRRIYSWLDRRELQKILED